MSQRARVLKALRDAGVEGVATTDFLDPVVVDGGPPIIRLPSRIDELRQEGHRITTRRQPNGVAVYVLEPTSEPTARITVPEPLTLVPSSSPYDPTSDWS